VFLIALPDHRRCKVWLRVPLVLGLLCHGAPAGGQSIDEYQAKAAFLFNFVKFVDWPSAVFKSETDPIRICVLGQNPFGASLDNVLRGRDVAGRPLIALQVSNVRQAVACQIVFVAVTECKRFRGMAAELCAASVLIVGEAEGFASEGGIVNFKVEEGKIRFEINLAAAEQAKLRISSKLLSLARVVK
jgi:hypothetical protein